MSEAMNRLEGQLASRLHRHRPDDRESSEIIAQTIRLMIDRAVFEMEAERVDHSAGAKHEG